MTENAKRIVAGCLGLVSGIALTLAVLFLATPVFAVAKAYAPYPLDLVNQPPHTHLMMEVLPSQTPPTLALEVLPDKMKPGSFTLHLLTTGFRFSPGQASSEFVFGQGHAHVYIDHVLISRAYGEWYHIPKLKPGAHQIEVTLNGDDHREYTVGGKAIRATAEVVAP